MVRGLFHFERHLDYHITLLLINKQHVGFNRVKFKGRHHRQSFNVHNIEIGAYHKNFHENQILTLHVDGPSETVGYTIQRGLRKDEPAEEHERVHIPDLCDHHLCSQLDCDSKISVMKIQVGPYCEDGEEGEGEGGKKYKT